MPRRRILESTISFKSGINQLSPSAFALWAKMLAASDDFGIVHGEIDELKRTVGISEKFLEILRIEECLQEICSAGTEQNRLMRCFQYRGKRYFIFDRDSFDRVQKHIIAKRTKSEVLDIDAFENEQKGQLSEKFLEILESAGNYQNFAAILRNSGSRVKHKALSINNKAKCVSKGGVGENRANGHHPESTPTFTAGQPIDSPTFTAGQGGGERDLTTLHQTCEDIPAAIVAILHDIGHHCQLSAYQNISLTSWRSDLLRIGHEKGFACLLQEAHNFRNWFLGQWEAKSTKVTGKSAPLPRSRFLTNWMRGCDDPKKFTTGDTPTSWPQIHSTTTGYFDHVVQREPNQTP